ncbi:MAG: hypothetical protein AB7P76_07095 [Candidatus Melainabacteria bacterium]
MELNDYQLLFWIKERLLEAGMVEELKALSVYLWTINPHSDPIILGIDTTLNPSVDVPKLEALLQFVLKEAPRPIHLQPLSIKKQCCYGNCFGCLNGSPEDQPVWVGRTF